MPVQHYSIVLPPFSKGFHLITREILECISKLPEQGMLTVFIRHTSAALTINENADPAVQQDLHRFISDLIPEDYPHFSHTSEGPDDMPAHIKASLFGYTVTIPIVDGRLMLGTWQGIYLCEFRDYGGSRKLIASITS